MHFYAPRSIRPMFTFQVSFRSIARVPHKQVSEIYIQSQEVQKIRTPFAFGLVTQLFMFWSCVPVFCSCKPKGGVCHL